MATDRKHILLKLAALAVTCAALVVAGCGGGDDGDDSGGDTGGSASLTPCNIDGKQQNLGASYVTSIDVSGTACPQAEQVIKAYHACRIKNGGPGGTCDTPVSGFDCTETKGEEVPNVQFNAEVSCTKGSSEIKSSYTQNF